MKLGIIYDMTNMSADLEIVPFSRPPSLPTFGVPGHRQSPYRSIVYK